MNEIQNRDNGTPGLIDGPGCDQFHALFNASPSGMMLVSPDGIILCSNRAQERIIGRPFSVAGSCGTIIGCINRLKDPAGCGNGPDCAGCLINSALCRALDHGEATGSTEYHVRRSPAEDLHDMWLLFGVEPVILDGKRHAILSVMDISGQKLIENELRDKMHFAENLVLNSTTPTFVINSDHKVLIWNRALEELTCTSADEIIGTANHWCAFYPEPRQCLADLVIDGLYETASDLYPHVSRSRLINDGISAQGSYVFDGRKHNLIFSSAPIRDRNGNIVAAVETLEDITDRISLEAQLLHAQKMESVGALTGGIAHDFNNVLTVISGYCTLLSLSLEKDEENRSLVDEIAASVYRGAEMTRSLLAFSGKHEISAQHDDLNLIVNSLKKSFSRLIREDICFEFRLTDEKLPVMADRVQIDQVLINLVVNARDALVSGGRIIIATSSETVTEEFTEGGEVIRPGSYGVLSVEDNGSGMDDDTVRRIFEPFFTTKEKGKGTGLGLSIVYGIVKKHGGHILVRSLPGSGALFRMLLPLSRQDVQADPVKQKRSLLQGTETVLVIEDDEHILKLEKVILETHGYTVLPASDGKEGIDLFKNRMDEIDIALVDVIMPRVNGLEAVESIREHNPLLPIIMASGYTDDIIDWEAMERLNVAFLHKPLKPEDLLSTIRRLLDGGRTVGGC